MKGRKSMRNTNTRKGFTTVELVIVIAVIAILATVLIPTFSNMIESANLSVDKQNVRNMNICLATYSITDGNPSDAALVKARLREYGYDGEGNFDVEKKNPPITEVHIMFSNFIFVIAAVLIPFAVFFSNDVKLWAIGAYGTLILIETFVEILVISLRRTKALADMQKHEKEEAERLRREQEQREQMGKWK